MADFLFNKPLEQDQQQTDKVKSITDYANEYTQKQNEHAANREKYGVEAPDEIYEVLNNFAQKSAGPEEDQEKNLARVAAAYAYSTNMNIPLEEAYVNLENYNAAIWGEDIFKNDRRSNGKAVMDQFKLGSNTVKQNKLGFKLMEAERDGDFELAEKINAEIAAIDEENALLQDYNPNNKLIKGLETIVQTVPFTLDVIAASAIGTISGTAVIPAFLESSRIQAGDVYKTLRDQGNSPEIARKVAIFTGSLQGLAESTIGEASNYFITKGMKGVGNGLSKAGADKLADYLTKKFALSNGFSKAVQIAGQYAISSVGEGAEELVQEVESILAENIAASLEDLTIPNTDAKDIAKRVTENFVGGIIGGLGLGVPGVVINTGLGIANVKRVEKAAKIIPSEEMYVNEMMKERTDDKGNTYRAADVIVHKDEEDLKNKLHDIWQANAATRNSEENVNAKGRARINPAAEGFEEYETDEESGEEITPDAYRENGKLSVQDDRETYDDGTVHGEYRAGDRTKADKNLYGAINYTIDEDNKTVTIDRFGMSSAREALRQEIYDSFAKKYTGYNIQWNAKGSQETAVRDAIIAANPMGKNAGLNYYTLDQVAAADAQTRNKVASQIQDAYKKVGIELDKEQIAADVAVMESLYNRIGRDIEGVNSFTDWYGFTFGENMFAEDASVAMKEGTEMGASQTRSLQQFREGMKALIYVTENGDFSTFSHEIAHIFRKQMQGDLLAQAEAAFGVQNGQWTRNQEERFAYGFEQFLRTGKAQNSALKELFTKIAQFLKDCFDALTKNGINITPEIEEVYNELLRGDESTLREAMRAAEESDKRYAAEREAAMKEQQQKEAEQKTAQEIDKESKGTVSFEEDPETEEERAILQEGMAAAEEAIKADAEEVAAILNMTPEEVENFFDTLMDESETLGAKDDAILDAAGNIFDDDLLSQSKKKKNLEEEDKTPRVDARRIQQAMDYLNSDAFDEKERNRIKNNLEKYEGSGWYNLVIQALTGRADMERLFRGENVSDNSLFFGDKCDGYLEACKEGPEGVFKYFTKKSLIGSPEKPEFAVAGSFISCEPSADCVKYCYAVAGRSGMEMMILNRELVNFCIEHDPIRAAQMVTSDWIHNPAYNYGKIPLRLLDTGDMSPKWVDFIKELNSSDGYIPNINSKGKKESFDKNRGVVCSIFSKRGELLSQVDPVANIIQLSVDKTNLDQAYKYPDLPLAIVFDGSDEVANFIASQKTRFDMHKGVILPVTGKDATTKEDLKKLPRWSLGYVCPINAGWKEIGEYHCGNCYLNGTGCNFGRSKNDRYKRYATIGEIPTGVRNANIKQQQEALIEELRRVTAALGESGLREAGIGESGIEQLITFMAVRNSQGLGQFDNGREAAVSQMDGRESNRTSKIEKRNKSEKADGETELLHQIIGELGATNLDRLEEVDTRIRNKQLAQWYETAGKDPLTIKRATGWEKGADGKWRYEIPDFKIKEHPTWTEMTNAGLVYHFGLLSELIDAPELFAAYPQLKTIAVDSDLISDSTEGSYNDLLNLISLNNHFEKRQNTEIYKEIVELEKTPEYQEWQARFDELEGETDPDLWEKKWDALDAEFKQTEIGKKYNELLNKPRYEKGLDPKLLSTLIHEVQHAIQSIEGFAAGGNPEMFPVINQYEVNDLIYKQREKVASLREKFESQINDEELLNHKIEYRQKLKAGASDEELEQFDNQFYSQYKGYENLKTESEILDNYIHQFNKISTKGLTGKVDITDLLKMNPNNADADVKETYVSPYEAYHRLAGEVESRNTQTRMDLSPEERLEKLLADTADVEPSQQIVMFNAMKEAMASMKNEEESEDGLLYQHISDPEEIAKLNAEETVTAYAAMQLGSDGRLYPPMAKKIKGKTVYGAKLEDWLLSDENPDIAYCKYDKNGNPKRDKNGEIMWYFKLNKDGKDSSGKPLETIEARYNPYWHSSISMLNDQFSSAYKRPNIVIVEVEIPISDMNSGYKAEKAKDPVGMISWHEGPVSSRLKKTPAERKVILSQYKKIKRIVPNSEVAATVAPTLIEYGITVPDNTQTPDLLNELAKAGVNVEYTDEVKEYNQLLDKDNDELLYQQFSDPEEVFIFKYPEYSREDIVDAWHGKKVNGEDLLDKMDRERRQVEADYKKLIDNPAFVSLHTIEGDQERIIHKSPRNDGKGKWQMSLFDKYGPYSHVTFDELDEAYNRSYELPYRPDKVEVIWDDKIRYDEKYYDLINNNEMDAAQKLLEEYAAKKNYFGPLDTEVTDATDIAIPPTMRLKKKLYTQNDMDASGNEYGLLFQTQSDDVRSLYENTEQWMKAPNGNKTKLTERQWLQVRTPSFKNWFGDWENDPENASKILDENGEPRIVYHDTNQKIFVNKETGEVWDDLDYLEKDEWNKRDDWDEYWKEQDFDTFSNKHARTSVEMPAFFFHAEADPYHEYGERRIAAYLNLRNPAINPKIENAGVTEYAGRDAMDKLIAEGYDGFIREYDGVIDEINAFYPNQIKSATNNTGDFSADNDSFLFQTQEEMLEEARQMESWQDWMQFYEVFGKPDVTPIPIDADAQWYKAVWEFANGVTTEDIGNRIVGDKGPAERASANDLDKMFIDEIETNDDFFMNFIELAAVYNDMDIEQEYGYISDEEDLQDRERAEKLQDMVHTIMSDRNMQYALKAAGAHNPIDEGVRKRVITEMTDAVKVRDFRALYAELANDNYYRVEEGEDFTSQLKSHYAENQKRYHDLVRSEDEIDKMSPQQRKMLAAEMNNRDLAAKIRSGELEMSDEIHDYMKSLDRQIDDLKKQMDKLQAETADDYKNLNTVEQRALLRLHDKLLDAKSKHDKSYDYIGKRIQQGLDITDNYKRQEKVLNAGYEGLYKRFNDIKKTMIINQDVELALKHQEDLQKLKDEIARQQQEKKLVAEVKELRKQLVKRTMRRVPLDKVDYDYAKTIIAIQTMLEPNLIGGVNRFIGTKNAFLRGVISGMLTDDDYRKQIIRYIEKTEKASKSSAMFTEKLKNIKDVNEIDTWDEATRQYAIKRLPKENWIRELDLIGLGEERRESMDLNINLIPVDNIRYNENGEEEHYTTYRLDADDEITARVREAVGDNTFNLLFNVPFYQWKTWQLEDLAKIINELYKEGRDVMNAKRLQKMEAAAKIRREIEATINNTGIAINDDDTPEEKAAKQDKINEILGLDDNIKGTNAAKDKGFKANLNRLLHGYNDANVLRFARILDGQKEGVNVQQLYRREDECYISKQKSINERVNKINKVLADNKITQEDLAKTVEVDGRKFTVDELLFFAAANEDYLEDETLVEQGFTGLMANDNYAATSRNAVMFGSMLSDTESLRYKQMLTEEDKDMQQRIQNGQLSHEETFEYLTKTLERNPGTKAYISACRERYQKVLDAAAALDPKYQALREVIADDYAEQYERMNETSIQEFNSPVHRTKCYVPIIRLESNGETNVNQVKEDLLGALGGAAGKQWVNKGMSMRRVSMSPLNQKPVQTGLYKTWTSSVERTEHFISYAPYVTDLNRIYKSRDAVFTRAFIEGRYGKGALRYLDDYINEVANPNANKVREAGAQLMHTLRGKTAPAYLSWKLSAIVKQGLTSPFPYMQFVDPLRYIAASAKLITSGGKGYDAIREKSVFMNNRVMDPMNDLIEEMEEQAKSKAGRKLASFEKKGMAGLEWIDWICVAPGWLACYEKEYARLNGKNRDVYENAKLRMQEANMYADYGTASYMTPEQIEAAAEKEMMDDLEKRAVQYADDCTRQCQPSNRAADIAPLFKNSSEAMKAYLQFQTSLNVIWQNIRYDIPYSVRQRQFWRIAGCVAGYTLAGIFMNAVMDGLPSNDDDDELKRLKALCYYATTQFTDSVPMIGSELTNTVDKLITGKSNFAASGTDMTPTATKFFSILTNAKQGNWGKAAQMTADGIGMYLGLPVSGLKEIEKLAGVGDGEDGLSLNLGEVYGILDKED